MATFGVSKLFSTTRVFVTATVPCINTLNDELNDEALKDESKDETLIEELIDMILSDSK
jgi:hypothetical protein